MEQMQLFVKAFRMIAILFFVEQHQQRNWYQTVRSKSLNVKYMMSASDNNYLILIDFAHTRYYHHHS